MVSVGIQKLISTYVQGQHRIFDRGLGRGGGGVFYGSQTQKLQSAKIRLNLIFSGGGVYSTEVKTQSAKSWPNFHFQEGEGVN